MKLTWRILLLLGLLIALGCREVRSYSHYNGDTKDDVKKLWGEPSQVRSATSGALKYGADEVWIYSGIDPRKTGGSKTFYFYFRSGVVVSHEASWWEAL